ncbi:MAG: substrate-binding domain-containing protein [Fuscovulum sp.]|nr:substrate-binding domain-containing protein [Fuscovulum sp.]
MTPDSDNARPTLKTIAAATGLAVATVSRALKDAPDIGEETKRRVRAMADRLGYRPNRAGVRLRTGKTNVIALILSAEADMMNHTARLLYAIANALRGTAYHMIVTPYFPDQDPMDPVRYIVESGSADGIILNQTRPDDPRVRYLAGRGFPFATHGRTEMGIDHPYFDFDNEAYARLAVAELARRGRRRLLMIPPPRAQSYARHMVTGFVETAAEQGLACDLASEVTSDSASEAIEAALFDRMSRADRPDGLITGSTVTTLASISGAERAGLRIGQDFDVVGKEAIPFLHRFRPEILIVREDVSRAGDFLARALIATIDGRGQVPVAHGLEVPDRVEGGG